MVEWISSSGPFNISIGDLNETVVSESYTEYRFTQSGSYNFTINNTIGYVTVSEILNYGEITKLHISMSLGPGSEDVDLSQLIIYLSDGAHVANVRYDTSDLTDVVHKATSDYFTVSPIRIRDPSVFKASQPVILWRLL